MRNLAFGCLIALGIACSACQVDYESGPRASERWRSTNGSISVRYSSPVAGRGPTFTDDDRDVRELPPGAWFEVSTKGWMRPFERRYTVRATGDGTIVRWYRSGLFEHSNERAARAWYGNAIQHLVRNGYGAESRAARILAQGGVQGVIDEIPRLSSDHAKATYLKLLFANGALDRPSTLRVIDRAGREIKSDYELANVLVAAVAATRADEELSRAIRDAMITIHSKYEARRVSLVLAP